MVNFTDEETEIIASGLTAIYSLIGKDLPRDESIKIANVCRKAHDNLLSMNQIHLLADIENMKRLGIHPVNAFGGRGYV